jgi:hypothetical protein
VGRSPVPGALDHGIDAFAASPYNLATPVGIVLSDEIVEFLSGGISFLAAGRDAQNLPECVRAVGLRVEPDRAHLTVFLSVATGQRLERNLRDNGRIAIVGSHQLTNRSLQIKGQVVSLTHAEPHDRTFVDAYLGKFADILEQIGIPRATSVRLNNWPAWAVRVQISELFEQTPGPGAGAPFKGAWS